MKVKYIALVMASVSFNVIASDVSEFSIRGVSPGMNAPDACMSVAGDFPDEQGLREKVGIPRNSKDWKFSVDSDIRKNESNANGCRGNFKGYDRTIGGAMTWADSLEIKGSNGLVYYIKNTQSLAVGDKLEDCINRRSHMLDTLVQKHGQPTMKRDKSKIGNANFQHLIWDYSSSPSSRRGDDGHEIYQIYVQCDMYEHQTTFAEMVVQTELHSGSVIQKARQKLKVKTTFQPSL